MNLCIKKSFLNDFFYLNFNFNLISFPLIFSDKQTIAELHQQMHELNEVSRTLKMEMDAYDRLVKQFGIEKMREKEEASMYKNYIIKLTITITIKNKQK